MSIAASEGVRSQHEQSHEVSAKPLNGNNRPISRYLHPDFFDFQTSGDPKASPLALLAQTCNNIGKDCLQTAHTKRSKLSPSAAASVCGSSSGPTDDRLSEPDRSSTRSSPTTTISSNTKSKVENCPNVLERQPPPQCNSADVNKKPRTVQADPLKKLPDNSSKLKQPSVKPAPKASARSTPEAKQAENVSKSPSTPPESSTKHQPETLLSEPLLAEPAAVNPLSALLNYPHHTNGYSCPTWPSSALSSQISCASAFAGLHHSPTSPCLDPYCHVPHRPCDCLYCLHQKLLADAYLLYSGLGAVLPSTSIYPHARHHLCPELSAAAALAASPTAAVPVSAASSAKLSPLAGAEYCMYCGKHCAGSDELLSHIQWHLRPENHPSQQPLTSSQHSPNTSVPPPAVSTGMEPISINNTLLSSGTSLSDFAASLTSFHLYSGADRNAPKLSPSLIIPSQSHSPNRYHPYKPPLPSKLAANLTFSSFGAGLV